QGEHDYGGLGSHPRLHSLAPEIVAGVGFGRNDKVSSDSAMTRTIGVLVFPNFQLLDAAGPITAFELANREIDPSAYRLCLLATGAGQVTSSSGITPLAESGADAPMIETLVVAGGLGAHEPEPSQEMLALVRDAAAC